MGWRRAAAGPTDGASAPGPLARRRRAILELRRAYPGWGKEKLTPLVQRQGWAVSQSTVGRILGYLTQRQEIEAAPVHRRHLRGHRRHSAGGGRPWAQRLPQGYPVAKPAYGGWTP